MKDLRKLMIMTAMMLAVQLFASHFYNIAHGNTSGRNYISISTMSESGSTLMSTLMTPLVGLLPFFLFSRKKIHLALGVTYIVMMVLPLSYVLLKTGFSPNWVYLGNLIVCCGLWAAFLLLNPTEKEIACNFISSKIHRKN